MFQAAYFAVGILSGVLGMLAMFGRTIFRTGKLVGTFDTQLRDLAKLVQELRDGKGLPCREHRRGLLKLGRRVQAHESRLDGHDAKLADHDRRLPQ